MSPPKRASRKKKRKKSTDTIPRSSDSPPPPPLRRRASKSRDGDRVEMEEESGAITGSSRQNEVPVEQQGEEGSTKEKQDEVTEESDAGTQRLVEQVAERLQSGLHIIDTIPEEEEEEEEEGKGEVRENQPDVPVASGPGETDSHDEQNQDTTNEPAVNITSTTTPLPNKETGQPEGDNDAILDDMLEEVLSKRQ